MRVLHIIVGLNVGGAESMLKRLIEANPASMPETLVVSLTSLGAIGASLRLQGVSVHALGMSSILNFPGTLWRLVRLIRMSRPDIVQTWMYHADFLGGLAARLAGVRFIVWNVRSTAIPQGLMSVTFWLVRLCAILSYFIPRRIICCANSAKAAHEKLHYASLKLTVISNGYDFSALVLDSSLRTRTRLELGFDQDEIVIGIVGRFDPLKDFNNFVNAASQLLAKRGNVKFMMVGRGNEWSNTTLHKWIDQAGLLKNFQLVGQQLDVPRFLSAMDIFCLSSAHEAFPNVLVEAMAMGLPCVTTQAGDSARILSDDRFVVPVKDSFLLANALLRMCDLSAVDRRIIGERNAKKVREEFGIQETWKKYQDVYNMVLQE